MSLIRNIEIIDQEYGSWSDGQSNLLDIALSSVMQYPSNILSFSTAVHWVPRETVFRNLTSLTYLGIHTDTEAAWVRWHLQNCSRLTELRLSFPPYGPRPANDCFDITTLTTEVEASTSGFETMSRIQRVCNIYRPINLAPYFKYSPSLRVLVIDVRQNIAVPETAFKLGIRELEGIVQACPSLEFLGLPVHLGNPHFRRYQRVKLSHQVPLGLPPRHPSERRLHPDKTSDKRCQTPSYGLNQMKSLNGALNCDAN
ncbi:uncharacterized protein BKA55DRAFT_600067 [Fusarium redolens]|uniref:F-box domain-containing protein n=1 Tax=Fusarium redolens TaxID=48865 RepID=A0A9P9JPE9_FUSRE|nr:uncharacterized protein BKA55DRAFT_600067 [Fusarium redolens]KAH7208462.1 hypothetical protein BKA55DRAFT_600067 [Fusarium redolens]